MKSPDKANIKKIADRAEARSIQNRIARGEPVSDQETLFLAMHAESERFTTVNLPIVPEPLAENIVVNRTSFEVDIGDEMSEYFSEILIPPIDEGDDSLRKTQNNKIQGEYFDISSYVNVQQILLMQVGSVHWTVKDIKYFIIHQSKSTNNENRILKSEGESNVFIVKEEGSDLKAYLCRYDKGFNKYTMYSLPFNASLNSKTRIFV